MSPDWLLAVETATRVMSVAVLRGEETVAEVSTSDARVHSERLLPAIEQALGLAGIGLDRIEAFALSIGPGSFTGLRIGLATLKGFTLGDARPVAPVPTLAGLAAGAPGAAGPVTALLDARRGEAYAAGWSAPEKLGAPVVAERVYGPAELANALPEDCTLVVGEDAGAFADAVEALRPGAWRRAGAGAGEARASCVGRLGRVLLARGEGLPSEDLLPRYVRKAEAEVKRTGQRFE